MFKLYLSSLSFLLLIYCFNTQRLKLPSVACPRYFQYDIDHGEYIGKISIPTISNNIELKAHFSQKELLVSTDESSITLENRNPLTYRVEFPSPNEVPKLTKITLNGQDICTANAYNAPSSTLILTHKLQTNIQGYSTSVPETPQRWGGNPFLRSTTTTKPMQPARKWPSLFNPPEGINNNNRFGLVDTETTTVAQPVTQNAECGRGNSLKGFIFGGEEVMRGEYPWLTAIFVKSAGLKYLCGGTLVSARTVLSAGHCFQTDSTGTSRLVVNLGTHNLEDFSEPASVTREVQDLLIHPEYSPTLFSDADLAVLHLNQPVQYSDAIRPICLWTENSDSNSMVGQVGVVAGWGEDEHGNNFTPEPKKVETKIVSDDECHRSSFGFNMLTSARTFCAGNRDNTGPCMRDSGGGLMISRNGRWYLKGIVSGGKTKDRKCNLQEFVVFCDVSKHLQWLQNNLV